MINITTIVLTISNCLVWTINSVSFWQIGVKMPDYMIFANWIGIIPYLFIIPLMFMKKFQTATLNAKIHLLFILCAFLSTTDSVLEIISDPRTGGVVQAILTASIPLPFTGLLVWIIFKRKFKMFEIIGSTIVIIASCLLIFESSGLYVDWWVTAFITGLVFGCIYTVIWEYLFAFHNVSVVQLMSWTTLYSIPFYAISIFVDGSKFLEKESNGFSCIFGLVPTPSGCFPYAWIPLLIYSLSSFISDLIQMYFVKNDSAYFLIIADTLTTPLTSIVMSFYFLFGNSAEPLTWYSIVSCVLVVLGILVYKLGDDCYIKFKALCCHKVQQSDSSESTNLLN